MHILYRHPIPNNLLIIHDINSTVIITYIHFFLSLSLSLSLFILVVMQIIYLIYFWTIYLFISMHIPYRSNIF